jgi:hypothetical protein
MALDCGLTSVRGNRGENYENEPWFTKNIKRKKRTFDEYIHIRKEYQKLYTVVMRGRKVAH